MLVWLCSCSRVFLFSPLWKPLYSLWPFVEIGVALELPSVGTTFPSHYSFVCQVVSSVHPSKSVALGFLLSEEVLPPFYPNRLKQEGRSPREAAASWNSLYSLWWHTLLNRSKHSSHHQSISCCHKRHAWYSENTDSFTGDYNNSNASTIWSLLCK